jgi:hypothetical protein
VTKWENGLRWIGLLRFLSHGLERWNGSIFSSTAKCIEPSLHNDFNYQCVSFATSVRNEYLWILWRNLIVCDKDAVIVDTVYL